MELCALCVRGDSYSQGRDIMASYCKESSVAVSIYKSARLVWMNIRIFCLSALFIAAKIMGFGIVIVFGELLNTNASFTFCGMLDLPAVGFTMSQQIGFVPADGAPCQHRFSFSLLYVCRSYSCLHMDCSFRLFTFSVLISCFQENMLKFINRRTFQLLTRDKILHVYLKLSKQSKKNIYCTLMFQQTSDRHC